MRLLLINYEYPPLGGGAGNATANIARELAILDNDVMVLTSAFRNLPRREEVDGFTIIRVPVLRRYMDRCSPFEMLTFTISATFAAIRLVSSWKPDATIAFFGIPSAPVSWALKFVYQIPYIVSLRGGDVPGHYPERLALFHLFTKPLIQILWDHAHAIVANSHGLQQLALQTVPYLHIHIIPNGVDTIKFQPMPRPIFGAETTLLFVGRVSYEKGLWCLLPALASLDKRAPFKLIIVGDGPDMPQVKMLINSLHLEENVQCVGWLERSAVIECYHHADIFLSPSLYEGMSNTVLEAMASGLPVIVTRIASNEELVQDGKTGILIPVKDTDALAQALSLLIADPDLRRRIGTAGRARVEREYSWHHVAESYLHLMQEI